jgi:serine/threonine protein kinase
MTVGGVVAQAGQLIADRYQLEERIGSGAMGVVWRAQDEVLRRTVAVKQLLVQSGVDGEEASARAMREGRIAARLQHPNAVTVYDAADVDGSPWLVMEFVPAPSLATVLAGRGKLSSGEVIRLGAQIASALAMAHANGIVHRDVKPGNVLLAEDGTAKITDFGISRANDEAVLTATGLVCGTPAYLAPEVAKGDPPDPASDVFALGATLYTAVEGEPPFGFGDNTLALLHIVAAGKIRQPTVTGPLAPILLDMLAADPDARPTMAQARAALMKAAADITTVRASDQLAATRPDDYPTIQGNGTSAPRVASRPPAPRPAPQVAVPQLAPAYPAGPAMPPPGTPAQRTRVTPPQPPKRPKRGNAGLIATISVVVLLVVVTGILATRMLTNSHDTNTANHPPASTTGANQAGANTGPVPTVDYTQMRAELINYYTLLPNDTQDAWGYLAPNFRPKTTFADFQKFYAGLNSVSVKNIMPVSNDTVDATITFVKSGGVTTHERYRFVFERGPERLLIVSGIRIGSA